MCLACSASLCTKSSKNDQQIKTHCGSRCSDYLRLSEADRKEENMAMLASKSKANDALDEEIPHPEVHQYQEQQQQRQLYQNQQGHNEQKVPDEDLVIRQQHVASQRPKNPYAEASFLSKAFFTWPYPLLKLGIERPLKESDLPDILSQDSSEYCLNYVENLWKEELCRSPKSPSLARAVFKDFLSSIWYIQPFLAIGAVAKVAQAVILGRLIEFFSGHNNQGYMWASLLTFCGAIILFEHHFMFFITWRKGMQLRISFVAAIYDKSLRLSSTSQDPSSSFGHITNLASNDVERFMGCALFGSYLFWAPIQAMAVLFAGVIEFGSAFAIGFTLLVLVYVPLQFYLSGRFALYRSKTAAMTDKRMNFLSQAVRGARAMKMSGYEWRFLDRIMEYRALEVSKISKANALKSWNEALFFSANVVISLAIFLVHVAMGGTLTQGKIYTVFALINVLQMEMTKHLSLAVMYTSELMVSTRRIQKYLQFPELIKSRDDSKSLLDKNEVAISFNKVTCYWNNQTIDKEDAASTDESSASSLFTAAIRDVSISFEMGQLTAIIGSVGSGKSALIQAICEELPCASGTIRRNYKTLAYAPQDPWIMDGTAKENILMGSEFDQTWYDKVVSACGLIIDFLQLPGGDQTLLGDRGVQCSGGQRARIGFARALYKDTDVLVLDDILSAVDAKVGRQLYQEAIQGLAVSRGKCVVLATHQHQYLNDCPCILVMNGQVKCIGSYEDCVQASGGKLTAHAADDSIECNLQTDESNSKLTGSELDEIKVADDNDVINELDQNEDNKEVGRKGFVSSETYRRYLEAMGGIQIGVLLLLLYCFTQGSVLVTMATVGQWARQPYESQDDWNFVGLVIGLGSTVVALGLLRAFICFHLAIKASQRIHDQMAKAVLRARIQFFDTNPLGRILNRFSADVGVTDDQLPPTMYDFFVVAFIVLGALATVVTTLPFVLVALPLIAWYFVSVRRIFVTSSRELKRLEGLARSPIFSMISESLGGVATIRANNAVNYFKQRFRVLHDGHTRAVFSFIAASRWVGFRMDSLVFILLGLVSFLSVLVNREGWFNVDPAILGLSLSLLIQLAGLFQWCIRQSAEVVNQMVSVERILEFGNVQAEAELECRGDVELLSSGWPKDGAIEVANVSARYRESLPLSLNNISFNIPSGARVGIVGRTGSGKSSLVQTLFRLLEAESGRITIDNVDISKIGLHALRTKISVIPQVPTLFSGCTIRENVDLFALHPDEKVKQVLQDCHLLDVVGELPNGWQTLVAEGGSNFSVGQRQLLCLARAILSNNRIIIMDEMSANVDRRTDQLLQEALRKSFQSGTILAVAHRLDTIIDFDLCLVLGNGQVLEYGSPADLIRSGGYFASMVNDTGNVMSDYLRSRAFHRESNLNE